MCVYACIFIYMCVCIYILSALLTLLLLPCVYPYTCMHMCTHTCVYIDVYMYIQDDYIHMYVYTCMLIHIEHILNLGAIAVVCIVPLYHTKWYSLLYMRLIGNGREERARCKYTISKLGEMQIHKRYPLVYLHLADFFVCSFPTSILFYFCIASICTFTFFPFYIMHRFHFCPIFLFLCLIAS